MKPQKLTYQKYITTIVLLILLVSEAAGQLYGTISMQRKMNISNQTSVSAIAIGNEADGRYLPSFSNDYTVGIGKHFSKLNFNTEFFIGYFSINQKVKPDYSSAAYYVSPVCVRAAFGQFGMNVSVPIQSRYPLFINVGIVGTLDRYFAKKKSAINELKVQKNADFDSAYVEIIPTHYGLNSPYIILKYGVSVNVLNNKYGSLDFGINMMQGFRSLNTLILDFTMYDTKSKQAINKSQVTTTTNGQALALELKYCFNRKLKIYKD